MLVSFHAIIQGSAGCRLAHRAGQNLVWSRRESSTRPRKICVGVSPRVGKLVGSQSFGCSFLPRSPGSPSAKFFENIPGYAGLFRQEVSRVSKSTVWGHRASSQVTAAHTSFFFFYVQRLYWGNLSSHTLAYYNCYLWWLFRTCHLLKPVKNFFNKAFWHSSTNTVQVFFFF